MAGENVASPALHPTAAALSSSSASQPQHISAVPAVPPTPGATSVSSTVVNSGPVPASSGAGGMPGLGHQQMGGAQQSSQSLQTIGGGTGQSVSLPGQHVNLQPTSAGQLHAPNLSQGQAFAQNQQNLPQSAALNQMNFQQTQQQKQVSGTRPQHAQYAQTQVNSSNMQAQGLSQQATSPAVVQSPPGTHSIPRTSSAQRLMQLPQATAMAGVRASTLASQFGPGSLSTIPSAGGVQQQLLLAQRAAQGQGAVSSQQRPIQPAQVTQQNQSGQTGTQQVTPSGMMVSSSARPLYGAQYPPHIQQQQVGGLARPGMGGQATGHPSMLSVQGSPQLSSLQPQFASQQMRQKQGQVQASQFQASATAGGQIPIGMMGPLNAMGGPLVRPSGSATQQQQRLQQMQTRPTQQQQQAQLAQQQTSLTSPQKLQAQHLQRPSVSSVATGLQSSPQSAAGSGPQTNQSQQPWLQKQMHHHMLQQQAAQQKQTQAQHSLQPHPQSQQAHLSQQTQQQQLGRVQPSAVQRPPTSTGVQPGTPVSGTTTTPGGAMSQPSESGNCILGKRSIQELVAQVDPNERLDPEVEDILLEIADDFIESVTTFACKLAKHRKSNILEAKDVLLHLNRNWDINIPGFGGEEYRAYKRMSVSETHKQRLALIKKSMSNQPTGQESTAGKASGGQPANASAGPQAPMAA